MTGMEDDGSHDAGDLRAIDALTAQFFAAFDNRNGRVPTQDAVVSLFAPGAVVTVIEDGVPRTHSPDAFAAPRVAKLSGGALRDFHEWETSASIRIVQGIAARRSRYAKQGLLEGAPYQGSGTKFFQFARFAQGWRIVALAWVDDAPAQG